MIMKLNITDSFLELNFVNPETQNISVFVEIPKKSIDSDLFNGMLFKY